MTLTMTRDRTHLFEVLLVVCLLVSSAHAQVAVRGQRVYTMAGPVIRDGVVVIRDGKIAAVGPAAEVKIPAGFPMVEGAVVTPGLIDAHATVGLSGLLNYRHDQEQLEHSEPIQPELRAIDAYNPLDQLVAWVRSFGITTVHTGHAPGELISGQTAILKTRGTTVEDCTVVPEASIACTLSPAALKGDKKSPGTRAKAVAMLRQELIKTREYMTKRAKAEPEKRPETNLRYEALAKVLRKEIPLLVTCHRVQDIDAALRLQKEFGFRMILDGCAESYLMIDEIRAAGVPVIVHPPMARYRGELENASFTTPAKLKRAGIPIAFQSGYESYVPKTRVVLFEAAIGAANGLSFEDALAAITIDAARILGIADRVGSLEVGKDGDVAVYDGDPFEYTTHCTYVIIEGQIVSPNPR